MSDSGVFTSRRCSPPLPHGGPATPPYAWPLYASTGWRILVRSLSSRLEAITNHGIKTVAVDLCTCRGAYDDEGQIKAHGWWPMRGNFVSALTWEVLYIPVGEPDAGDSSTPGESDSDGELSDTASSTSE
ncbi:hypothetical protein B0H14DRAFT_3527199 [Mycena olivaceomarginata]|nr:hypothetical protein B0H14DRAFT_3527199 [Mycena olivaceomarginata]